MTTVEQVRTAMLAINSMMERKVIPPCVHLALGHEALAVAVKETMQPGDVLLCSHRNIHYNLAFGADFQQLVEEIRLSPGGINGGTMGTMNIYNKDAGILYTSSILGNNLSIACGVAWAKKHKQDQGVVTVITGDGAIEEGAFYEALEFIASQQLRVLVIIEDNGWSLATRKKDRRCDFNVPRIVTAFGLACVSISVDDGHVIRHLKENIREAGGAAVVIVNVTTQGGYTTDHFINYHAGVAHEV